MKKVAISRELKIFDIIFRSPDRIDTAFTGDFHFDFCKMSIKLKQILFALKPQKLQEQDLAAKELLVLIRANNPLEKTQITDNFGTSKDAEAK